MVQRLLLDGIKATIRYFPVSVCMCMLLPFHIWLWLKLASGCHLWSLY